MPSPISNIRRTQVIANNSAKPSNVVSPDNVNNISQTAAPQSINPSPGQSVAQSQQVNQPGVSSPGIAPGGNPSGSYAQQLGLTTVQNPLNVFANYTYHIRFSIMNLQSVYSQNGSYATMNSSTKLIIAESGVTAGFNISEFEFKNTCAPGPKNLNTTNTTWTMTIIEPYGMSFIDKMFLAAGAVGIKNWSRSPYLIEVWFNGYNLDGTLMSPTQFYTLYRVSLNDINVRVTEGGSVYELNGVFSGDIGHSNEISIPDVTFQLTGTTVLDFFNAFANALNNSQPNNLNDSSKPNTQYVFSLPSSDPNNITTWPLKPAGSLNEVSIRSAAFNVSANPGNTTIKTAKGASIENIVNTVIGSCDQVSNWISASGSSGNSSGQITTNGISTWIHVHSYVQLGSFNNTANDYDRNVIFNLVPYQSVIGVTDRASVDALSDQGVQQSKLSTLNGIGALVKEYDYLYTGLNTEIIKFDISVDSAWALSIPQFAAMNSYYNFTAGPIIKETTPAYAYATGNFTNNSPDPDTSSHPTSVDTANNSIYIEDLATTGANDQFPFSIVVRQTNKPTAQLSDLAGDGYRAQGNAKFDGKTFPFGRALVGSYLANLFDKAPSFMNIEVEIRGDPYWMGNGNVIDDGYIFNKMNAVSTPVKSTGSTTFSNPPYSTTPTESRANYLLSSCMFILAIRTGQNYNESTGIMTFESSSQFYNGAYVVTEVTNSFKQGSFTQTLSAYKDPLAQIATASIPPSGESSAGSGNVPGLT